MLSCCKPLVSFQSSEKVDSDSFCQFFHCFVKERIFQGPYFIMVTNVIHCLVKVGVEAAANFPNQQCQTCPRVLLGQEESNTPSKWRYRQRP